VADENADRVYVPGAEASTPARDVEPFWADEPETPVHGRAVPLADRVPPVGMVQVEPGVFRPADGPPLPPGVHVPSQRFPSPTTEQRFPSPIAEQRFPSPTTDGPPPAPAGQQEGHTVADSPWAQPLHRPAPATQPVDQLPVAPQPPVRPVPDQPLPDAWPTVHAPAVPPRAQHNPQPPHAAPVTPPTAPVAAADDGRGAAGSWPAANAAPPRAPVTQPPHQPRPGLPKQHPHQAAPQDPAGLPMPQPGPEADPFQELSWMVDGTPTAEEFARRRLARPAQQSATMGARAMLQKGMFGLVKLSPGQRELEYKQDVEMVRRNFGGLRQVTVVNPKGGAGKTVAVLLLAMTFGQKRGGYVLAWDNNETQGTLGMRAQQDFHARTVRDMMRDLHLFQGAQGRVGDLSQYVRAQGEGMFDVLASDESATAGEMLTASSFAEIRDVVSRFYKLIFVDTGNNVRAENWQAAMDATDQLVITMSARNDSAETAARALDHLEQSGRRRLVRQAVTIVTMPPTRKDIDLQWIQQHFAARTRAVLVAPYERLIDSGEPIRYGELSTGTKDAWLKIAAAVADGL
jgi:MinD-like ATPase involved in chromosome partitioning or flagellar assembly